MAIREEILYEYRDLINNELKLKQDLINGEMLLSVTNDSDTIEFATLLMSSMREDLKLINLINSLIG